MCPPHIFLSHNLCGLNRWAAAQPPEQAIAEAGLSWATPRGSWEAIAGLVEGAHGTGKYAVKRPLLPCTSRTNTTICRPIVRCASSCCYDRALRDGNQEAVVATTGLQREIPNAPIPHRPGHSRYQRHPRPSRLYRGMLAALDKMDIIPDQHSRLNDGKRSTISNRLLKVLER
ncbi:MAG: hypothetical protein H6656_10240 [Ardenticatenaceae bacterium]|nr:hypothetical protein [Ardenticatenaceae bacterium]